MHIDTKSIGLSIFYFKRSKVEFSIFLCISVPEGCFKFQQTVKILMKCSMTLHFIWCFTVCQSSRLGVSSIHRFKAVQNLKMSPVFGGALGQVF